MVSRGKGLLTPATIHSSNKGWFAFYATLKEAEKLLHTEYYEYEDSVTGEVMPTCEAYHVPGHISKHVDYITPGIKLLALETYKTKREAVMEARVVHGLLDHEQEVDVTPNDLSTCDVTITPACVAALYHIPASNSSNPKNSMGIFESELQFYQQNDLNSFFTSFTHNIPNGTHPIAANIDGGQ